MSRIVSLLIIRMLIVVTTLASSLVVPFVSAQENVALPDAPGARRVLTAQAQTPSPLPSASQSPAVPKPLPQAITLEQALELARQNNPALRANDTLVSQNKAQEITANLRPNPVLQWDTQFIPIFSTSLWSDSNYWETQAQYDVGIGYLFERGKKRQHRLDAAKTTTAVTEAQVSDAQRTTLASAAQLFVAALLAKSNLEFAEGLLDSYRKTVALSEEQLKAGRHEPQRSLKIQLQQLQFESDANAARLAKIQALTSLRQLLGFDSVPADYDVAGNLVYEPVTLHLEDLQARALNNRPDLQAAQRTVKASESQVGLAKANGKVDLNVTFDYTRLNQNNLGAFYFSLPSGHLQQEPGRNRAHAIRRHAIAIPAEGRRTAGRSPMCSNSYEALRSSEQVVKLFDKGYLDQATQSLEITKFSYEHGATSLLDFLDAERSYRSTQLSYRQALASYMTALEQLRQAVGSRELH